MALYPICLSGKPLRQPHDAGFAIMQKERGWITYSFMCISKGRPGSLSESTETLAGCLWYSNVWNYKQEAQIHSGALRKLGKQKKSAKESFKHWIEAAPERCLARPQRQDSPPCISLYTTETSEARQEAKGINVCPVGLLFYLEITHPFYYLFLLLGIERFTLWHYMLKVC